MTDYVLQAEDVAIHYGGVKAVDGVALTLEKGQIRGLIGPNGAGKTTTLKMLAGLLYPPSGAAKVLGRDDIGRLAAGARADLVVCDLDEPNMLPMRDPLRNLIHSSGGRCVRDVWVDGHQVVAEKRVLTIDWAEAAAALQAEQDRTAAGVADLDGCSPRSLPLRG